MTEPFKFVVSNDPAKARQAIGTLGVPAEWDSSGDTVYQPGDLVTRHGSLYRCTVADTSGDPEVFPGRWSRVVFGGDANYRQLARTPELLVAGAVIVDGNDLVTSAAVVWPDGTTGTLTITSRDSSGAVLAYNITCGAKTFTQPTITRNANGAITNLPAIEVS